MKYLHHSSTRVETFLSTSNALSGYLPAADSLHNINASARCRTTSATSATWNKITDKEPTQLSSSRCLTVRIHLDEQTQNCNQFVSFTSARVGIGLSIIDCSRWDATMTGFPNSLPLMTIAFCTAGTSSNGICAPVKSSFEPQLWNTNLSKQCWGMYPGLNQNRLVYENKIFTDPPKSPLATMSPSEALAIESRFRRESELSIFAIIYLRQSKIRILTFWQVQHICIRVPQ